MIKLEAFGNFKLLEIIDDTEGKQMKRKFYFAYGSNLDEGQMKRRCPGAKVVGVGTLQGYQLELYRHATIVPKDKEQVPGLIWSIDERDELALDRYEGAPQYYRKADIKVLTGKGEVYVPAMVYIMNEQYHDPDEIPAAGYLQTILRGYESHELPMNALDEAVLRIKERQLKRG